MMMMLILMAEEDEEEEEGAIKPLFAWPACVYIGKRKRKCSVIFGYFLLCSVHLLLLLWNQKRPPVIHWLVHMHASQWPRMKCVRMRENYGWHDEEEFKRVHLMFGFEPFIWIWLMRSDLFEWLNDFCSWCDFEISALIASECRWKAHIESWTRVHVKIETMQKCTPHLVWNLVDHFEKRFMCDPH